jgi:mono/diheme cytochrome c family protein
MRLSALLLAVLALAGCDDMIHQRKKSAWTRSQGDPQTPPAETVQFQEKPVAAPPLTLALLQHGGERFHIYCAPCHSELGDGHGMIVQRGFSPPPSYEETRLREGSTQHFYDVITQGHGAMYSFAQRVPPADRWAIGAYIRALQLSQQAVIADLSPSQRVALEARQ